MSEHFFGMHSGHLKVKADQIAERYGACHVNYTDANGSKRGWFACPNRGHPFDDAIAKRVLDAIDKAGGFESLKKKR